MAKPELMDFDKALELYEPVLGFEVHVELNTETKMFSAAANPAHSAYEQLAGEIDSAIRFMDACGADFEALKRTEFFASHEALLLDYERALTRTDSRTGLPYDTSGHFIWIGERTRAAIRRYQQEANLPVDGQVTPDLARRLREDTATRAR